MSESVKVRMVAGDAPDDAVVIPKKLVRALGLPDGFTGPLSVGGKAREIRVVPTEASSRVVLSHRLAKELLLPLPRTLWMRYDAASGRLRVGPVVAIFAVKRRKAGAKSPRLFGARNLDIRYLMRHAKRLGLLALVVTPDGVRPDRDWVEGYVPSGRRWAIARYPIPDVVYDRIQSRSWERRPSSQRAKEFFRSQPALKYFNEGFFDKWALYQKMLTHEALAAYLPVTRQLTGPQSLKAFLEEHGSTFLKPTEGSQGKGIVRVRRLRGMWEWRRGGRGHRTARFDTLYQGIARIQRRKRYIMQPDLGLATVGGSPFDVRILMQKDGTGTWKRTKIYVRVAPKGRLTSNLSRGGTAMGLGWVLRSRFGRARRRVRASIDQAARDIVHALDEVFETPLGELGLDLGIDRRGRVWLIEVNAKPFRKVFDAGPKRRVFLSFRRPMAYARYLAGF